MPAGLADLAGQELDLLQLDYRRARAVPASENGSIEFPGYAAGIAQAARTLVKPLFLDPDLRIITSAGWGDAFGCVEQIASIFIEGGCGDLPLAAVRGSNLLPILEMLEADGVPLTNAETGAAWRDLKEPLLAADLQLGGGPIAMALAESARVIVAGCYDDAAPAAALAVREYGWSWRDFDSLASAAVAARAAAWRHWDVDRDAPASLPWTPGWVELDEDGRSTVNGAAAGESAPAALERWLKDERNAKNDLVAADVRVRLPAITCKATALRQISISGAAGAPHDGSWRLEILYQAGFSAEAMVEFSAEADRELVESLTQAAHAYLSHASDPSGLMTVEPLRPLNSVGPSWLHLAYQSKSRKACQFFADQVVRLFSAHEFHARLAAGTLRVQAHCGVWPVRVPRDAVDIAVETRAAKEWV
ncbi:MAG TPA: acyclic terpene utilization AtuA family protein [Lacipirellula sp.]